MDDPIKEFLGRLGIEVESRQPSALETMVAGGLGSLTGQTVAQLARCGPLGAGLMALCGGAVGLFAVTYRSAPRPLPESAPLPESE